jgi:hypothetical protein
MVGCFEISCKITGQELYLIGASLKGLGKKCFGFMKMDPDEITSIKARV